MVLAVFRGTSVAKIGRKEIPGGRYSVFFRIENPEKEAAWNTIPRRQG